MRVWAFLLLLCMTLPAIDVASQATPSAGVPETLAILQDVAGDVRLAVGPAAAPNASPRMGTLDLLAAHATEKEESFEFSLQVAQLDPPGEPPLAESAFYELGFIQGDIHYAVQIGRIRSQDIGLFAQLARLDPGDGRYYLVDSVDITADVGAAVMTATVPRDLLVDSNGAKPYPGTSLVGFYATSASFLEIFSPGAFLPLPGPTIRDRMPDVGNGTVTVPVLLGPVQVGSAHLDSKIPFRQSNGEATTFLFSVRASNLGTKTERFSLTTERAPREWDVQVSDPLLELSSGQSVIVPILVTTPFIHVHGTVKPFMLDMKSLDDASSHAQLELGIRYPKIPQPAGHHSVLSIHSTKFSTDPTVAVYGALFGFNVEYGWMNALPEDAQDGGIPLPADPPTAFPGPATDGFHWAIGLSPELAIGLDFNLQGNGSFDGEFQTTAPLPAASLSGEVVYYVDSNVNTFGQRAGGNRTVLATLSASPPQDVAASSAAHYQLAVKPTAAADLLPFRQHSTIVLELHLATSRPDAFTARDPPKLSPGAILELPLREYHDPVDTVFASQPDLTLHVLSGQDRAVNPGKTALYKIDVRNEGSPRVITLNLTGPHSSWARIVGDPQIRMAAGTNQTVALAVEVPHDAAVGDIADIVVHAEAQGAGNVRALARVFTTVQAGTDIADDAALVADLAGANHKASPTLATPLTVLALVGIALVRKRR